MRHISASYVFPVSSAPLENGIITVDPEGRIISVLPAGSIEEQQLERYEGVICPGFVNTHCHLELSHLRGMIPEKAGMTGFIRELLSRRGSNSGEKILEAIASAEDEMIRNGIVAVGDISNDASSFAQKAKGRLNYHTFIEIFSMDPAKAGETFENGRRLLKELTDKSPALRGSVTPHAPYTLSEELLKLINAKAAGSAAPLSLHNQESEGESELFISGSGPMYQAFKAMGIPDTFMRRTGMNSLHSTLPHLDKAERLLLVHNTFTSRDDIQWAERTINAKSDVPSQIQGPDSSFSNSFSSRLFWCSCPNANLYIEGRLPEYDVFLNEKVKMTLGTDSLASNHGLSILDEMKTIASAFPHIPLETLLSWACLNGAEFLGFDELGAIEKGRKPGLNLLKNLDGLRLTAETQVLKLV